MNVYCFICRVEYDEPLSNLYHLSSSRDVLQTTCKLHGEHMVQIVQEASDSRFERTLHSPVVGIHAWEVTD